MIETTHTTPVWIYGEPDAHKFCAVDIFLNITRRQAILPVAKFHHVLGRGFMIQQVILILMIIGGGMSNERCFIDIVNIGYIDIF